MRKQYVITDGAKFVRQDMSGKYTLVSNLSIANTWDSSKVAEAILENSLSKAISLRFYIGCLENGKVTKFSLSSEENKQRRDKLTSCNEQKKEFTLDLYSFDDDENVQKLIQGFEDVRDIFNSTVKKYRELEEELCSIDYIIEDLTHYLGRKTFDAYRGYKLNDARQRAFLKRVSIKNQMELVKGLNKHYAETIDHIQDICTTIDRLRNQTYKPRMLMDLFENDEINVEI